MTVQHIEEQYFTEEEMAQILKIKVETLRSKRARRKDHPPFTKLGIKVVFPKTEVQAWLKKRSVITEVVATAKPAKRLRIIQAGAQKIDSEMHNDTVHNNQV